MFVLARNSLRIVKDRKVISSKVHIHDRTRLETVFSYSLKTEAATDPNYRVDAFFYFPRAMQLGESVYNRTQFYRDLNALVRLREPTLSYDELMGHSSLARDMDPPLTTIQDTIASFKDAIRFGKNEESKVDPLVVDEAKVFACSFLSYFWRRVKRREDYLSALHFEHLEISDELMKEHAELILRSANKIIDKARSILNQWRGVLHQASAIKHQGLDPLVREMKMVDEYCTMSVTEGLTNFLHALQKNQRLFQKERVSPLIESIQSFLMEEKSYSLSRDYLYVDANSSDRDKEAYIYRRGLLKRRIWSVLYLNPRENVFFSFQKQVGPMIAAGMAAGWAFFASLLIWRESSFSGFQFVDYLPMSSLILVTFAFVFAYILKDRIKEMGRKFFERGLLRTLPDIKNNIVHTGAHGEKLVIGFVKEFVDYKKSSELNKDIQTFRRQVLASDAQIGDASRNVVHYAKYISLNSEVLRKLPHPVREVSDVIRLNVDPFLSMLDNPMHVGYLLDEQNNAVQCELPKVYYLDLVLRYLQLKTNSYNYNYFRIALNKNGLLRVEKLAAVSSQEPFVSPQKYS